MIRTVLSARSSLGVTGLAHPNVKANTRSVSLLSKFNKLHSSKISSPALCVAVPNNLHRATRNKALPSKGTREFPTLGAASSFSAADQIGELRVLLLSNSFNSMTQRAYLELKETYGQDVRIELAIDGKQMINAVQRHNPDVVLCPFLTKRIPEEIWKDTSRTCLVVHPGIHGDRGGSSIDWALQENQSQWGVTVLQADEEMDAGDIWSTKNFPVPCEATKSTMYSGAVVDAAMDAIHESLEKIVSGEEGIPLDYSDPAVKGTLRANMKLSERSVDFNETAVNVAATIRVSDSSPGAPYNIDGHKVFLYGAHVESSVESTGVAPGTITGKRHGAVRIACAEGEVWVTHMKGRGKDGVLPRIKLPATEILPGSLTANIPELDEPNKIFRESEKSRFDGGWRDMWATISNDGAAVLHFPFLNGAMSTSQCKRLTAFFEEVCAQDDVKTVTLAGGISNWSNGINLNTVEASNDAAQESWENINAINDFVKAVFSSNKITIAALQGNAGAGGAMAALACDFVWAHGCTVLNPHYKSMGLHGSEYWTYFLPKRVGHAKAMALTEDCMPVSAATAQSLGMVDAILAEDRTAFMEEVHVHSNKLAQNTARLERIRSSKIKQRTQEWYGALEAARTHELRIMRENFLSAEYRGARESFVHKISPTATPLHLSLDHYRFLSTDANCSLDCFSPSRAMKGGKVSKLRLANLEKQIDTIKTSHGTVPKLAVVIVSGNEDSERYVQQKSRSATAVGVSAEIHRFEHDTDAADLEDKLIDKIHRLNESPDTNGIMVQIPLPVGVDKYKVLAAVSPSKDVDGFAASNLGGLSILGGKAGTSAPSFTPCTAKGIMTLLDHYAVSVVGKKVCVIGRSCLVGLPTTLCLMDRGATVSSCDLHTTNLREIVKASDIVIASAGSPNLVKADWIKPGAVVVDVGFHVMEKWSDKNHRIEHIVGDVDIGAKQVASLMTPVPGGVGPMTVASLLENTVDAFLHQQRK